MPYDLIVIGSGPGGYSAAIRAGQYGLKTALIEKQARLGGTCLLVGCIPTKALLQTADVWERFVHSDHEGIHCENPRLDYPKVKERKDGIVTKHSNGVDMLLKRAKVERISGYATLKGGGKVEVKSDSGAQTLEAKNIILATGSEARMLPGLEPDPEFILTNIEILNLHGRAQEPRDHRRGRGGRGIRLHLQALRHGSDGHRNAAAHRAGGRRRYFEGTGAQFPQAEDPRGNRRARRKHPEDRQRRDAHPHHQGRQAGSSSKPKSCWWPWAASRTPKTSAWKTRKVELDRGFIKVDEYQQTAEPGVYAIGDVVAGTPQLAHVATREGMIAVAHMAGKPAMPINKNRIPGCTYTEPGIGSVGLTEAQARAAGLQGEGRPLPVRRQQPRHHPGPPRGLHQGGGRRAYGEILGVHIIGPEAFRADRPKPWPPWKPRPPSR